MTLTDITSDGSTVICSSVGSSLSLSLFPSRLGSVAQPSASPHAASADPSRGVVSWVTPFAKWSCLSQCREGCSLWPTRPPSMRAAFRCCSTCLSGVCSPLTETLQCSVSCRLSPPPPRRRFCLRRCFRFLFVWMFNAAWLDVCGFLGCRDVLWTNPGLHYDL